MKDWQEIFTKLNAFWKLNGEARPHVKTSMSGKHVDSYFNSDMAMQHPKLLKEVVQGVFIPEIQALKKKPDWVIGYAPYSIGLAMILAEELGSKFGYSNPKNNFDISFSMKAGDTAIVVADDMYGGGAALGTIEQLKSMGVEVSPLILCLANMTGRSSLDSRIIVSAVAQDTKSYMPDSCELCQSGSEALIARDSWSKLLESEKASASRG